jgi:predicted nucleic-acid-binding protein
LIAIDTNVLLRAVMADDPVNTVLAQDLLGKRTSEDPAYINVVVLAEFVWSLRVSFKLAHPQIEAILRGIIESDAFVLQHRAAVLQAFLDFEEGIGAFTDRLIAELNLGGGCEATMTLDRAAAKNPPFALLARG